MRPGASVAADPDAGFVRVGATRITMTAADAEGVWRFGGPSGAVLRSLRFGERTELVTAALAQPRPRDAVASAVLTASTLGTGDGDRMMLEVLALWLAGAEWEAPEFTETAMLVGRTAGWPLRDLLVAPATEVDRLAVHLAEEQRGGAWRSIVFLQPEGIDLAEIRDRFADELLRRSTSGGGAAETGSAKTGDADAKPAAMTADAATASPGSAADALAATAMTAPARDAGTVGARSPFRLIRAETKLPRAAGIPPRDASARGMNRGHPEGGRTSGVVAASSSAATATLATPGSPEMEASAARDVENAGRIGMEPANDHSDLADRASWSGNYALRTAMPDNALHATLPGTRPEAATTDETISAPAVTAPFVIRGTHEVREAYDAGEARQISGMHDAHEARELSELRDFHESSAFREAQELRDTRAPRDLHERRDKSDLRETGDFPESAEIRESNELRETGDVRGPQLVVATPSIASHRRAQFGGAAAAVNARGAAAAFVIPPQPSAGFDVAEDAGALRVSLPASGASSSRLWTPTPAGVGEARMFDVARELAAMLDDEADLRGVDR
jgi:hypothetical protein